MAAELAGPSPEEQYVFSRAGVVFIRMSPNEPLLNPLARKRAPPPPLPPTRREAPVSTPAFLGTGSGTSLV